MLIDPAPNGCHLEQTACYGDILEEVNELVLIGEVVVKEYRRRERETRPCRWRRRSSGSRPREAGRHQLPLRRR
jgi:hypothetical protein